MRMLADAFGVNGLRQHLRRPCAIPVAVLLCGFGGAAFAANPPQYAIKDLGTLGGKSSSAAGINASGQVTGASTLSGDQITHGFIYSNGALKDIGVPPGDNYSSPSGINATGQLSVNDGGGTPWLYSNGLWIKLDPQASYPAYAWGINDSGHVTGITQGIPFFYNGTLNFIPYTLYPTTGRGINNSDLIAGTGLTGGAQGQQWPFVYNPADGSVNWLGSFGGLYAGANAINSSAHVAGWSDISNPDQSEGPSHAFLQDAAGLHDLGTLGGSSSHSNALNDSNEVVGDSSLAGDSVTHAFLFSSGVMMDLNSLVTSSPLAPYVTLTSATGINANGWIIANGVDSRTGNDHAYLLEPSASPDGTVSPPAADITDSALNTWTVSNGQVSENGQATQSSSVIELLYSKNVVYQENAHRNWYAWLSGKWVASAAPISPSASGAQIPAAASIVDSGLNIWALSGGQVYENGTATPSAGVILILYDGGVIYQENLHHNWWLWNPQTQTWIASSDPRVPSANLTSIPAAPQIIDGALNTWTLLKGQVFEDGQATQSSSVVRVLLSNGVVYQENTHGNWYAWVNGKWVASPAPISQSGNATTIPSAAQIIDAQLNIWTVASGVAYENHARTQSSSVILLLFYGGSIYQENTHHNWYRWSGSAWTASTDPRV